MIGPSLEHLSDLFSEGERTKNQIDEIQVLLDRYSNEGRSKDIEYYRLEALQKVLRAKFQGPTPKNIKEAAIAQTSRGVYKSAKGGRSPGSSAQATKAVMDDISKPPWRRR